MCARFAVTPNRRLRQRLIRTHYDRGAGIVNAKIKRERHLPFPLISTLNVDIKTTCYFLAFFLRTLRFAFAFTVFFALALPLAFFLGFALVLAFFLAFGISPTPL
jgi:hypothetical protein